MRNKGISSEEVRAGLQQALDLDTRYDSGRIPCSMCTSPHQSAKLAHDMFVDSNLGDPGLFPGTAFLEKEVMQELGELLHSKTSAGHIVSGGTEANLMAVYAAREIAGVEEPEIIVPESVHFSFNKICNMLRIKMVRARLDGSYRVDVSNLETLLNKNTAAIVGVAGSTELGMIDPIEELSRIALDRGIYLHVDAAFGGLTIPFLKELGYTMPEFDFALEGVQSITVDPHKMGMSTIPSGGILFRDSKTMDCIRTKTPYLTVQHQCTFVGTRSGASAASAWAAFASMGREGFRNSVSQCMEMTLFLQRGWYA